MMIKGNKGGDKPKPPVESPNTLKSTAMAKVLDLVSEGEIVGLADGMKSIFLDETPLQNADLTMNFKNVIVEHRYGTQTQSHIAGFPDVENEVAVGVELTSVTPYTHAFTNLELDSVRIRLSTPAMTTTDTTTGNITGRVVQYAIDMAIDGGPYNTVLTSAFNGKCVSKYERSHRIDLPAQAPGSTGWIIRVRRITANSSLVSVQDKTFIESYTEVIDAKLRYPNSAIVGVIFDSAQFQSIPTRAYDLKGRIIRVPSNYDPETRVYDGIWDGTFQLAWTDNPAWIYYDLITHPRYGLGHIITDAQVNKWKLYTIGQYCDELVPDGLGGMEPRFVCNLYLQTQGEAYRVLRDLATVFRGMVYWGGGEVFAVADMPEEPAFTYTPANVLGGKFVYQGSAKKTRSTVALVSWADNSDFGRQKVEYVDDQDGIARYGVQQVDATAIGCSSQSQAHRMGRYILLTGIYEPDTVSFAVGLEGTIVAPGRICRIADPLRAAKRMGGRISAATTTVVTTDAVVDAVDPGDELTIIRASDGIAETRAITVVNVDNKTFTVSPAFSELPQVGNVWAIDRVTLQTQRYRVLSVTEGEDLTYNITAVRHNESKFDAVDLGTDIIVPPISDFTGVYQAPPTDVEINSAEYAGTSIVATRVTISWDPAPGAQEYEVQYQRDNSNWILLPRTPNQSVEIVDAPSGLYEARVKAINGVGTMSRYASSAETLVIDPIDIAGYYVIPLEIVGGYVDVDCSLSEHFSLELTADAQLRFFNIPSSERVAIIQVTQAGGFDLTMPLSVTPVSGVPYVATQIAEAVDMLGFYTDSKGVAWQMRYSLNINVLLGGPTEGLFAVTLAPSPAYDYAAANPSLAITATPVNGTPPYTYQWTKTGGGTGDWGGSSGNTGGAAFSCSAPTAATTTFSRTGSTDGYVAQNWICTVTDSVGMQKNTILEIALEDDGIVGGGYGYIPCPHVDALLPGLNGTEPRRAGDIKAGNYIYAVDPRIGKEFVVEVTRSETAPAPGVRVTTQCGVVLTCSTAAPLPAFTPCGYMNAADMLGHETYVCKDGVWLWSKVIGVKDVGEIAVQHITCYDKFFLVGDVAGQYMAHHNIKWEPDGPGSLD